jgi:DNA-directed RNA polymerase specialized sigma24 family protein
VSTQFKARTPVPGRGSADLCEELALVARASRRRLLSVHRRWLRHEDLEDCYSQATLELLAQARRGALSCTGRAHLRHILEQRFVSRIVDRRRALSGRSPRQATLDRALSLGSGGGPETDVVDARADVERLTMLRFDVRSLELSSHALTLDQRLVLACQLLGMSRHSFCARFGWSHEKYRKVAQRARARLRRLLEEMEERPASASKSEQGAGTAYELISPQT